MATGRNPRARRTLFVWGFLLAFVFALTVAANIAMARYAREARDQRPETYLEMAELLLNQGAFERALETWQEAYDRAPNSLYVHRVLGDIHYNAQHWEEALRAYQRAIALGSRERAVYVNTLWSLVQLARYREALNFANLCLEDGIAGPELYRRASEACFRGGMMKESIPFYENALRCYKNDLYLMEHLKQAYSATGDKEKARAVDAQIAHLQAASGAPAEVSPP